MVEEIDRVLQLQPRGIRKRVALAAGLDSSGLNHRITEKDGQRFTVEQLGAIADELEAPAGWPWIPWELAEAFDAWARATRAMKSLAEK